MTTPFPKVPSQQNAENSILDVIGGKQIYLGNAYILPWSGVSLSNTSETVLALIKNTSTANSSTAKTIFLNQRKVASDNNTIQIRFYASPTITSTGAATTPLNLRSGYASLNTSIAGCYFSPSISANGSLIAVIPATIYSINADLLYALDPGYNLLVTGQQIGAGTSTAYVELSWYEI